ncbi:farnesyl pyrophosphate synthase-like [Montipora foliosa]|uniref:farnesyl pyrophosphate synthase-like n=1 Tax=Montipora foliosa TaxID=591990 RepID=UPI0035F1A2D0
MAKNSKLSNDRELFDSFFPGLVDDIVKEGENDKETGDALRHMREVLEYNVPGGKRNRGLSVIGSLRHLVSADKLTEEEVKTAIILGWCVEWLQAFFLVADDIMDESLTRRGKPCWYIKAGVNNIAVNDFLLIEATIYKLLRTHLHKKPYYVDVLHLFHEVTYQTATGQTLDLITQPGENFENFTLERYKAIVKFKTAFYSFYLPVALAMHMAGIKDGESHEHAKVILLAMGEFFQIQDDYLDCYGDPSVTGKVGTDIEEKKCSWLVVQALQRISLEQMQILKDNYGVKNPASAEKVKALYHELQLKKIYQEYEEESYQRIRELITQKSGNLPKEMFLEFVKKIYKRDK